MRQLIIEAISCLKDNYAYLISEPQLKEAWVVDPSEAEPIKYVLAHRGYRLQGILATHHHHDHVGGIADLLASTTDSIWVAGHAYDQGRIPGQTVFVDAPTDEWMTTELSLAGHKLQAMHIPGHTLGAIAWYLPSLGFADNTGAGDVFTGDTLFAAGCGRLFEGTPTQMYQSLQALVRLPLLTRMWFGHEYTAANLRFAATVEPDNIAIQQRISSLPECTTPTTVELEKATNPFVRAKTPSALAALRQAKDHFRG